MEIEVSRLVPGMVLQEDVLGKSGKTIVPKNTKLTATHIEFMKGFAIDEVSIPSSLFDIAREESSMGNVEVSEQMNEVITRYKEIFATWKNSVPINMYEIRRVFMAFFEEVMEDSFNDLYDALQYGPEEDKMYREHILSAIIAIQIANEMYKDKRDWLQVGFGAVLSHSGKSKLNVIDPQHEDYTLYPLYSYRMVESITTLNKQAKVAVLQHQERIDGSGYPTQAIGDKIHPFAQIIGLSQLYSEQNMISTREKLLFVEEQVDLFNPEILEALKSLIEQ